MLSGSGNVADIALVVTAQRSANVGWRPRAGNLGDMMSAKGRKPPHPCCDCGAMITPKQRLRRHSCADVHTRHIRALRHMGAR